MSGSGEEFNGLINATAALFINGGKLVRYLKKKLKKRSSSNDSARDGLEASLSSGSSAIQSTYSSFLARLGPKFAQGDDRANDELTGSTIQLQELMQVLQNVHVSHEPINFKRLWHMSEWSLSDSLTAMGKLAQRVLTSTLTKTIRFTQPRRRITAYENVSESSDTWPDSETVGNETWSNPSRPDTETLSQYPSGTETTRCGTAPIQTNGSTNPRHRARFDDQTEDELVTRLQPNTMDVELSPTYCIQAEIARYETSGDFAEHVPDISSACSDCGWGYGARPYPIRRFMFESHLARPVGGRALRCYKCFDAGWVIRSMADEEFLQHLELHGLYEYRY